MGMLEFKSNTKDNYIRLILGWQKLNNNNLKCIIQQVLPCKQIVLWQHKRKEMLTNF